MVKSSAGSRGVIAPCVPSRIVDDNVGSTGDDVNSPAAAPAGSDAVCAAGMGVGDAAGAEYVGITGRAPAP